LDVLQRLCRAADVWLLEDCAQATGGRYAGRRVGSWGDIGVFSLGGVKLMTCAQGGIITMSNPELYDKCYALVNRGMTIENTLNAHGIIGENYQLSELAAATLGPQLDVLDALCAQRERRMTWLDQQLAHIDGLTPFTQFPETTCRAQMTHAFFCQPRVMGQAQLLEEAKMRGLPLHKGYAAVSADPRLFGHFRAVSDYPVARAAQDTTVAISHRYFLEDDRFWTALVADLRAILQ